jgi:hypothetical protein
MNKETLKSLIWESYGEVMREMAKPNTRKVNNEISSLTKNRYFDSIPTTEMQDILDRHGFGINVETGERVMDGIFTGQEGKMSEPVSKNQKGQPNVFFTMTWYKMSSGRFEIVAYVW